MGKPAAQRRKEYLARLKAKNNDYLKTKEKENEAGYKK